jgi:cyclopropane-fatty-acyl-phospholipid synthase
MTLSEYFLDKGVLPETVIRWGIKKQVKKRLKTQEQLSKNPVEFEKLLELLKKSPIAVDTSAANEQHYQVPTEFYKLVLGPKLKYSCCNFVGKNSNLALAEIASLEQIAERAQLKDGHKILDLGCGWGSFTLWTAEKFPNSSITAVSNSNTQRQYIEKQAKDLGLTNIRVITIDINNFNLSEKFDRIISVEMFEHMRNYESLFKKISSLLDEQGLMFVHVFCHKKYAYLFQTNNSWMGRYFFTGGIMPAFDLFKYFQNDLKLNMSWEVSGQHYEKTANAWAENLNVNKEQVLKLFASTYGESTELMWYNRWLAFFLACAELFGYSKGQEWGVAHYLFEKQSN